MSFTINPRVLCVLSLAVVSVAGRWTGAYNATESTRAVPAPECIIKSFASEPITAVFPCTCTGGNATADCNWTFEKATYSTVRDADCKCATTRVLVQETDSLKAYTKSQPNAVNGCVCDAAEPWKGEPDANGLVVPDGDCWCPSEGLKASSGLKEAKEGEAILEDPAAPVDAANNEPVKPSFCTKSKKPKETEATLEKPAAPVDAPAAPVDAAAVKKCNTELDNKGLVKQNLCDELKEYKPTEMPKSMKTIIPSCTIALLTEICKSN
ncbi:hypothetical protein CRV24_009295 [Beauveria bassiana]|nr:hypothetical protein CRV24_009295 [Beauveria bassiana]KAH8707319.1 hypothetical protein HC256_010595 [Beauveria bassiana]